MPMPKPRDGSEVRRKAKRRPKGAGSGYGSDSQDEALPPRKLLPMRKRKASAGGSVRSFGTTNFSVHASATTPGSVIQERKTRKPKRKAVNNQDYLLRGA